MGDLLLNKAENKIKITSKIKNYEVFFENSFDKILKKIPTGSVLIVDQNLRKKIEKKLKKKNFKILYIAASEKSKSFEKIGDTIKKLIQISVNKTTTIVAIGGGTIQDLVAFISSIFFRGIDWIFVPTTLLSQCDSCIGGKTSINFHGIKNQLGNFYPPNKIFINFNFLKDISKRDLKSGLGEMSHFYFVSGNKDFLIFDGYLKKAINRNLDVIQKIIKRSLSIKKIFIEKDEFDKKERIILNYGHSFGHAIEKITKFKIPHGIAVANGMNIANFVSFKMKYISKNQFNKMSSTLDRLLGKDKLKKFKIDELIKALKKDKKNLKGSIRLILTKGVGKMFIKKINDHNKIRDILFDYQNTLQNSK